MGFMGNMGTGKTLSQTAIATLLHKVSGVPLFANYGLKDSTLITKMSELWDLDSAILCLDEIWINMDARLWKDNVFLTRFINQTRKKRLLVLYTTQHIRQVELRVRNATDILVLCEKTADGIYLNFIDWQFRFLGRRFLLAEPERFYHLYNTFELVHPITMDKNIPLTSGSRNRYNNRS